MQIRSVMTSCCLQLKMVKYWIDDISGDIEAVFLKLGTIIVHHKRNTMTPLMPLPWQQFGHWCCLNKNQNSQFFVLNQEPSTPHNLLTEVKTIWELFLFQVAPFVSFQGLQMGYLLFEWKELLWQHHWRCHFVSFVMHIYGAKFQEHCFNISKDIVYSVFYHF